MRNSIVNPYFPPYLAFVIGEIVLLGVVFTILVIIFNKKPQSKTRINHYEQIPHHFQPAKTKQYEYSAPKRMFKCPYCSSEENVDRNFCPRCGAKLK